MMAGERQKRGKSMPNVVDIRPNELARLSELVGGRKVRDFEIYHIVSYPAAGSTNIDLFRVNGAQEDVSGVMATVGSISNMVTSGKFDEPFLIKAISVYFDNGSVATGAGGLGILDVISTLMSGKLTLEINNNVVFERAPLARVGAPTAFNVVAGSTATLLSYADNKIAPHELDPYIFCEEGVTVRARLQWSTLTTVTVASKIGVFLHGAKYFKA